MTLSGAEFYLVITVMLIGLIGNLKLRLNDAEKNKQIKWNFSIYGAAILIFICGLLTPPDILSNIISSVPLAIIYIFILRKFGFKKLKYN